MFNKAKGQAFPEKSIKIMQFEIKLPYVPDSLPMQKPQLQQ